MEPTFSVSGHRQPERRTAPAWRPLRDVPGSNLPVFAVGEISDKTGQIQLRRKTATALTPGRHGDDDLRALQVGQGADGRALRPCASRSPRFAWPSRGASAARWRTYGQLPASDFVLVGRADRAELQHRVRGGIQLFIKGIGGGARTVVINVALDVRVINSAQLLGALRHLPAEADLRLRSRGQHLPLLRGHPGRVRRRRIQTNRFSSASGRWSRWPSSRS